MEIDRKELKRRARVAMGRTSPKFWTVTLAFWAIVTGMSLIDHVVTVLTTDPDTGISSLGLFSGILVTLFSWVITFGYQLWSLWAYRELNPGLGSLFQGFSVAGRVVMMQLMIAVRVFGWAFLLILVLTVVLTPLFMLSYSAPLLVILAVVTVYGWMTAIELRYAMAPYLLADYPDDGAGAAVARSVVLIRGHKWELFKLHLSFLGWELINILLYTAVLAALLLSSGAPQNLGALDPTQALELYQSVIDGLPAFLLTSLLTLPLSLWLKPYMSVSEAGFYATLRELPHTDPYQMPPV